MSRRWIMCAVASLTIAPVPAPAQSTTMTPLEVSLACAPPPRVSPPPSTAFQIAGGQDTTARSIFAGGDTLVIAAGKTQGLEVGQQYYVRHAVLPSSSPAAGMMYAAKPAAGLARTAGWIRVVSVDDSTALATIEHACDVMTSGDYLEPYAAPAVPPALIKPTPLGALDFASPARVLFGDGERTSAATGEFVVADRAATPGARFAIYRDLRVADLPLTSIGEAVVVSEGPNAAVLRIVQARDAVFSGDYLVPEKK